LQAAVEAKRDEPSGPVESETDARRRIGAAERYLDAARFGCDLREGPLIHNLVGISIARTGFEALGRLILYERDPPLAQIRGELERLAGALPSVASGMRIERLVMLGGVCQAFHRKQDLFGRPLILPLLVPYRSGPRGPPRESIGAPCAEPLAQERNPRG
jgi:hypothetical protein